MPTGDLEHANDLRSGTFPNEVFVEGTKSRPPVLKNQLVLSAD
jgi:hypothetical protein